MREEVRQLGVESNVDVISMGVDFANLFHQRQDQPRESEMLLFVGRLAEKKGVNHLIAAMPAIISERPQVKLVIVGEGPEEPMLRQLATKYGVQAHIEFAGAQPHEILIKFYLTATVAILPFVIARSGDREGLPVVVLEALGCGCAVVASDLNMVRGVIKPGVTGLLTTPGDPQSIADAAIQLLQDESLRNQLANDGRDYVLNRYDWSLIAKRYGVILHQLSCAGS